MRWQDVRGLRLAVALYLVWWVVALGSDRFFRAYYSTHPHPGQIDLETGQVITALGVVDLAEQLAVLMTLALPFVVAVLAGWWRATALQGGSWLGGSLLLGLLAGLFSIGVYGLVSISFSPKISTGFAPDLSGLIIIGAFVYGPLFGALGGIVGGLAARASGRGRGSGRDGSPA